MTNQLNATTHANEVGCFNLNQDVSTTGPDGKTRVKVGEYNCLIPTVERFMTEVDGAKVTGADDDGLPVYDKDAANWLFRAIMQLAKTEARNKLQPKTAELKPGAKLPETFAELVAPPAANGSTVLAELAELARNFAAYLAAKGIPAAAIASLSQLVRQQNLISFQGDNVKAKFAEWLGEYATTAAESGALTAYQESAVIKAIDIATGNDQAESLDDLLAGF